MLLLSPEGSEHRRLMSLGVAPSQTLFCQHRRLLAVTGCDPQRQWLESFFDALIAHPALVKGTLSPLPIL